MRIAFLLLLAGTGSVPAVAQSPTQRESIAEFRDSLNRITAASDPVLAAGRTAPQSPDPMAEMRRGLVWLRIAELSAARDALDRAEAALDEAVYRAPNDWPWPWYLLARAKVVLDRRGVPARTSMHQPVGDTYRNSALRALS